MALLFTYLFLALIVSFLCSIMEAVLLSTPQTYLVVKREEGKAWAVSFLGYKTKIDQPLSAILSLNTVAHTVGAAGVGAQVVKVYGEAFFGIASAILTLLILIFTEIIPKTVGAKYWKSFAQFSLYLIQATIIITYPLVLLSSLITRLFSRKKVEKSTSREEIAALASIGADEGIFSNKEDKIIQNVLKLKSVRVKEIMTPRVVVVTAEENLVLQEFLENKDYLKFSRIPIYNENEENITGYVLRQHIFENIADENHTLRLKDVKRKILIAPNSIALFSMWEMLLESKEHIAMIVDEYGGLDGIVTMEDIIETMLGLEIVDEKDTITDMQAYAKERWKMRQAKYNLMNKIKE